MGPEVTSVNTTTLRRLLGPLIDKGKEALKVESTCVRDFDYSLESNTLTIVFHQRGTYQYHNVPLDVFVDFADAFSLGKFFNLYIRDNYSYERVG